MTPRFDLSLIPFLKERLAQPLPGKSAQRLYAHAQSYGRHFGPHFQNSRRAAVLVLMRWAGDRWWFTLMRRPPGGVHSGQICFPGGGIDPGETVIEAALRECGEETGWTPQKTDVIGQLSPIYVYGSDNFASCVVAMTTEEIQWSPDQTEVAELIEVPVEDLCRDEALHYTTISRVGLQSEARCFFWQNETNSYDIWGATSMMISELKSIIMS